MGNKRKNWQQWIPWVIGIGLLSYLFTKFPPSKLLSAFQQAQLGPLLGFVLLYFLVVALLDTTGLHWVLKRFAGRIQFRDLWPARCVSYLVSLVNYNAGQAGLAVALKKSNGFSFFKTLGEIFFVTATDLYWIILLAFIASFFHPMEWQGMALSPWIQKGGWVALVGLALHLLFWNGNILARLPKKFHFSFFDWIRGRHLFQAFRHAKLSDYLKVALLRLPLHLFFILSMWVLIHLFGASITWKQALVTVPLIFFLGTIPITPGGLGTVQLATVELLKNQVTSPNFSTGSLQAEEMLFALSLAWMGSNYIIKALVGLFYLWRRSWSGVSAETVPTQEAILRSET